jgi:hypothetical protein
MPVISVLQNCEWERSQKIRIVLVSSQVLGNVTRLVVLWVFTPCSVTYLLKHFGGMCCVQKTI